MYILYRIIFYLHNYETHGRILNFKDPGPYSPTNLKNVLRLVLQILLYLKPFECNRISDWPNHMVWPIRSFVTFKCTNLDEKDKEYY